MAASRASLLFFTTLLLAGCSDSRSQALKTMKRFKRDQLRKEVALYYKDLFAEDRKTHVMLNPQYWSYFFKELHPERITAYPDGFAFCLESTGDSETGLYVVPMGMEHEPKPTRWASFEKISDGIFWYSFKP